MPSGNPDDWAIIRIFYPLPNSISILVTNDSGIDVIVPPNPSIENIWQSLTTQTSICGANNFYF